MSECKIETLPWPVRVRSLNLVAIVIVKSKNNNTRHLTSFRSPAEMKRAPLGAAAAMLCGGMTSVKIVSWRSWATDEGSPADVMIFPRGAIKFIVLCFSELKDVSNRRASACAS